MQIPSGIDDYARFVLGDVMKKEIITSLTNPKIKNIVKMREHKHRRETGLILIEGYKEVSRAVAQNFEIKELFISPELFSKYDCDDFWGQWGNRPSQIFEVSNEGFLKMSYGERAEGIIALAKPKIWKWDHLKHNQNPLYVVLEKIEKPGNLGAILRTCDGIGVDGVIVCEPATDVWNPNVIRASIGAVFSVPVIGCSNQDAVQFLKNQKVRICTASPEAKKLYFDEHLSGPLALVLGTEHEGLSEFWGKNADVNVRIPMKGTGDSLNVSISAAVLMYEALRQRMIKK